VTFRVVFISSFGALILDFDPPINSITENVWYKPLTFLDHQALGS